jgi:hypothetical protein
MIEYLVIHIVCGLLSAGISFAWWQKEWPNTAEYEYWGDMIYSYTFGISLGPIQLLTAIVQSKFAKHGIKYF